jgi:hypothetical protein
MTDEKDVAAGEKATDSSTDIGWGLVPVLGPEYCFEPSENLGWVRFFFWERSLLCTRTVRRGKLRAIVVVVAGNPGQTTCAEGDENHE